MVIDCAGLKMKTARVAPDRGVVLTLARQLAGAIASCLVGGAEDRRRRMGHDAALADMFPGSPDPRVAGRSAQIGGRLNGIANVLTKKLKTAIGMFAFG